MGSYTYDIMVHPYDGGAAIKVGHFVSDLNLRGASEKISLIIIGHRPHLDLDGKVEVSTTNPEWTNPHQPSVGEYIPAILHEAYPRSGKKS